MKHRETDHSCKYSSRRGMLGAAQKMSVNTVCGQAKRPSNMRYSLEYRLRSDVRPGCRRGGRGEEEEAGHDNPVFLPANRVIVAGDGVARV